MAKRDKAQLILDKLQIEVDEMDTVRFALGDPDGRHSSIWRVWGNKKGDFYFSSRRMGGTLKSSLHRDRLCHFGYTQEYAAKPASLAPKQGSRFLDEWKLPDVPFFCAARIVIPESELRQFPFKPSDQVHWLPAPDPGSLFTAAIYVLRPDAVGDRWPGADHGSTSIGRITTRLRTLWVVGWQRVIDDKTSQWLSNERAKVSAQLPQEKRIGHRVTATGARPDDGSRWYLEIAWQP